MSEVKVKPTVMQAATNYKPVDSYPSRYRFLRVPLNNISGNSVAVTPGGQTLLEFKLPAGSYNLGQSYLYYNNSLGDAPVNSYNWTFEDIFDLGNYLYFGTAGGLQLTLLYYPMKYVKIARKIRTKLQDYMSNDVQDGLYPSNVSYTDNQTPVPQNMQLGNVYGIGDNNAYYGSIVNNTESQYVQVSLQELGAHQSGLNRFRRFPLSSFVNTIVGMDKVLYFPTEMYLRFNSGPGNLMGFTSTSNNAPVAGNSAAPVNNGTTNNIYLYLAIEQNQVIIDSIMAKVNSPEGLSMLVDWTTDFRIASIGAGANNVQIQLNSGYGRRLKRMLFTVWNSVETGNTAMDCSNWNGSKITYFQTFIDQRPLQDFQLQCGQPTSVISGGVPGNAVINGDAWRENRKYCKDSVIINSGVYDLNWFHIDQMYEENKATAVPQENIEEGLDMEGVTRLWSFQGVCPSANVVFYTWATFQRRLTIRNNVVTLE